MWRDFGMVMRGGLKRRVAWPELHTIMAPCEAQGRASQREAIGHWKTLPILYKVYYIL